VGVWVRGMTVADCPTPIEMVGGAAGTTLVGTDGDNVNDEYEVVLYE
jgi:hypothetical protein